MSSVRVEVSSVLLCLACSLSLRATPLVAVDSRTTCFSGLSQALCTSNGNLTGPAGAPLPSSLADLILLTGLIGESDTQFPDRSAELADLGSTAAPLVVGPQMVCSVQVSFDPRLDLGRGSGRSLETMLEAKRAVSRLGTPLVDSMQIELTLGTALTALESEHKLTGRAFDKKEYVNFALVNQFHDARPGAPGPEQDEEDDLKFE